MAVDTLGLLLVVHIAPPNEPEHARVRALARQVLHVTSQTAKLNFANWGYTRDAAAQAARDDNMELKIIEPPEAKNGFVPLLRHWFIERSVGWLTGADCAAAAALAIWLTVGTAAEAATGIAIVRVSVWVRHHSRR